MSAHLAGRVEKWPPMDRMAAVLRDAGLHIAVGTYSIRVNDCSHFVFQEYGGDLGDPQIDADADTPADMLRDGRLVSNALARAGLRHRFEIFDDDAGDSKAIAGYLHHDWPLIESIGKDSPAGLRDDPPGPD